MVGNQPWIVGWGRALVSLGLALMLWLIPGVALAQTPQADLAQLDPWVEQSLTQLQTGDLQAARTSYRRFATQWEGIEGGIRSVSPKTYYQVEKGMAQVMILLAQQAPATDDLTAALTQLHQVNQAFIATPPADPNAPPSDPPQQTAAPPQPDGDPSALASMLDRLDQAQQALTKSDPQELLASIWPQVQADWVEVEGRIASRSSADYDRIETLLAEVRQSIRASDVAPDPTPIQTQIQSLRDRLQPYRDTPTRYGIWDAMVILLREGVEALLVIVALLTFLNKSGSGDKRGWIWAGAGAGILASIATAAVIRLFFSALFTGANQELIEGITGVSAALVLIYVSYWLHSRSSAAEWKGYIQTQVKQALQRNGVFSLALLAFLAIYREGAETVLFYIGIAPSISTTDLLLGLGLGGVALAGLAGVMFGLGVRLPLRPFFLITSLLVYFLGFKFLGNGFHALQVAGILPSHGIPSLPAIGGLGLYPTWETLGIQLIAVALALGVVLLNRSSTTSPSR